MRLTYVPAGTPGKRPVRFSHVPPSLRVNQTLPSSVPAYNSPGRTGDSASDTIVQNVSAPVTSGVTPPVVCVLAPPQLGEARALRRRGRLGRVGTLDDDRVLEQLVARPPAGLLERGALAGGEVQPPHVAALRLRVHDVRVGGVLRRVEAVAAADG